ncbi:MAG: glycosyltransferase family 2 protein [Eubacterium sp.]|nr:glycosyltransferase family 2 protein [Eubacterium sp.]
MRVLVIIPAYNEEEAIIDVVDNLKKSNDMVDYVIINDCSTDNTESILKQEKFNYISLPVNLGIGGGVQTGYRYAVENNYDIALQMDGDGQHDPEYIKNIIQPIVDGKADMVIGSRFIEKNGFQSSGLRRVGIKFLSGLIKLCCGTKVLDVTSGFRATGKQMTAFFANNYAEDYPEPEAIIAATLNGFKVKEVAVLMHERQGGESSINAVRSIYYMIKVSLAIIIYRLGNLRKEGGKNNGK